MNDATTGGLDKIAPALAKAQAEMSNPPKTKTANVGKYKYRYADLAEIIDHVRATLGKHGLAVTQIVDGAMLRTLLMHESGQTLESRYDLPAQAAAQEMGSAITYARRYSLCAILGIAAEEDDDGEKAMDAGKTGNDEEAKDRDELIERMGASNLGPIHILNYVKAHKLGLAVKDLDSLSIAAVRSLLEQWAEVVASAKPIQIQPPDATPAEKPKEPEATKIDLSGLDPKLAEAMRKDGITKAQLKGYYTGKGHVPATVEPEKLPAAYIRGLLAPANWSKAVEAMSQLPF